MAGKEIVSLLNKQNLAPVLEACMNGIKFSNTLHLEHYHLLMNLINKEQQAAQQ